MVVVRRARAVSPHLAASGAPPVRITHAEGMPLAGRPLAPTVLLMSEAPLQRCERRLLRDCGRLGTGEAQGVDAVLRERLDGELADFLLAALPVLLADPDWIDRRSRVNLVRDFG